MPARATGSTWTAFRLLRSRTFVLGMAATGLAFMEQNALSIYIRPFLENVTRLEVGSLSLTLLGLGVGGIIGTSMIGFVLRRSLTAAVVGLPAILALLGLLLIVSGPLAGATITLLVIWGFFATPIPVAWGTWLTRIVPDDLEAGGGLQVALTQLSIAGGAFAGGVFFDTAGWSSTSLLASVLLTASAGLALIDSRGR
jgi:predicted MFS family arabinose efflux permease